MQFYIIGVLIIIVSIVLILIVLIQNPKGGGLNSSLGSMTNQIIGASKSVNTVERFTWYIAGTLILLSIVSVLLVPNGKSDSKSEKVKSSLEDQIKKQPVSPALPGGNSVPAPQQSVSTVPTSTPPTPTPVPTPNK